jgi:hypothetical protein
MSLARDFLPAIRAIGREPPTERPSISGTECGSAASRFVLYALCGTWVLMTEELAIAKRDGIVCIVDGGHSDMGRDIELL